MDKMGEVLGRCWVNPRQVSQKTGGGQVNCWEEVLPLILLMAGAEVLSKGLRISALGLRVEAEGLVSQEGAPTLDVNPFSGFEGIAEGYLRSHGTTRTACLMFMSLTEKRLAFSGFFR